MAESEKPDADEQRRAKERERWHRRMQDPAFRESERERHRRQVQISIGGESVHVGYVPTLEAADTLRGMIVAETPKIRARVRAETDA
jgi:hypothetical protein